MVPTMLCAVTQVPERLAVFYRSGLAQRVGLGAIGAAVAYSASKSPRMSAAAGLGVCSFRPVLTSQHDGGGALQ